MASASAVADLGKRLLEASRKGTAEEVSHLMATGAPLTTDWLGTSPLHLAAQYGHTTTADVLLRAGVSRDGKTKVDKTPLHLACQHGHLEIVKLLVKHGADVHVCDMLSMTPLHWTCERDHPEIAQILLEAGARKDIKNKFGKTPMDIARARGHVRIVQLLKQDYSVGERKKHETESFSFEVRKRAKTRKFPMTAGSWGGGDTSADHDRQRQDKSRKSLHMKRRSSESEDTLKLDGDRMDTENNLSSLVSAAAIVRSKSMDDPKLTAVTAALSQNAADASVLDTLATLATCAASGTQILSNAQAVPAIAPGYITLSNFHGLQANGGNLVATSPLGANIHTGLLSGIQLAPPITLNVIQGSRLPVGQSLIASSTLPQGVAPNIGPQAATPTAVAQVVNRDGTQMVTAAGSGSAFTIDVGGGNLTQTLQLAGQDPSKSSEAPLNGQSTTLSIVGSVPSQSSGKHAFSHQAPNTPSIVSVATSNAIQQTFPHTFFQTAGVPQGSIPVNIPVSLLNSLIAGGVVHAQGGIPDEVNPTLLPRVASSEATCVTSSLSTTPSSAVKVPSPQPALVAGSPTPIPVVPLAGLGGVQLIPNQALFPQQFVTTLRPITPLSGATPMLQQQQLLAGGTIPIPVTPVNLSSILPTAVSLSQLPIAQQQVVTSGHLGSQGSASVPIIPGFQIDQGFLSTTKTSPLPSTTGSAVLSLQNFVRQETSLPKRTLQILHPISSPLVTATSKISKTVDMTSGLNLISSLAPMVAEEMATRNTVCASDIKDNRGQCEEKGSPTPFPPSKHDATQKRQLFPQLQQLIHQHQLMEAAETHELPETALLEDRLDDDGRERSDGSEQFESQLITPRVMGGTPSDNDSASLTSGSPERENNNQPPKISSESTLLPTVASVSSCRSPEDDVTSERVSSERLSLMLVIEPSRREELSREELKKQLAEAERKTEQYRERLEKAQREISQREEREKQKGRLEVGVNAKALPPTSLGASAMPTMTLASLFSLSAQSTTDGEVAPRRENAATD